MGFFFGSRLRFFIIFAIAGFIAYDIDKHGSFKGSKTGIFLRDSGALRFGELALTKFRSYCQQAYRWSQKHLPGYISPAQKSVLDYLITARDILTALATQLWLNLNVIFRYFVEMKPVAVKWLNQYAPGLVDNVTHWLTEGWSLLLQYIKFTIQWLKDNVFIGSLSAENLQRLSWEAFNTTQTLALRTFSWINGKMTPIVGGSSTSTVH